ncbi:DHA2 family efflux MFS transporter permease subunit [Microbacterium sp. ASV49]|uniref:DHA2 family efflux MFS transporter permease subunit n=1 Tax=Microbacterium candidum TaxID=3041922 RepID=A0ABT7N2Y9_9MICO|nr:DHA2 family efflux MFS transporter permease subunit [Microbacterium sp. ASV49]MDL9981043.1 DHA2 family efflux MFS transporter permease subunit [Microbacterium sp. ASV49]
MSTSSARRVPVWIAVVAASLPMFMSTLDNLVVTNALPAMRADLGASIEELQWFVNAFTLAFASFILAAAALGDRIGRRTVFILGIGVFTAGSVLSALSTEPWMVTASRALSGFGAAGIMPLSLTLLAGSVPDRLRPAMIGIWGGVAGLGVALGPLIGGAVVEGWNWQAIFWLNVPVGIVAIPLALFALPNTRGARLPIDLVGVFLAGLGVLGIVFGLVRGNDAGWDSLEVTGSLVAGAALLIAFVLWERRTPAPLLPLRLFRDRSFTVANIAGLLFSLGMFGSVFILIQYLQVVRGASPLQAGLQTMPWTLAPMFIAPLAGLLAPRVGTRALAVTGLTMQTIALTWMALEMSPTVPYIDLVPAFLLAGVGMALVFAPLSTAVLANMPAADHAKASGTNSTVREVGTALGVAVLTAVFTGAGGQLTPTGYVDAAVPAVLVGAAALGLGAIAALFLPAGRGTSTAPASEADAESTSADELEQEPAPAI